MSIFVILKDGREFHGAFTDFQLCVDSLMKKRTSELQNVVDNLVVHKAIPSSATAQYEIYEISPEGSLIDDPACLLPLYITEQNVSSDVLDEWKTISSVFDTTRTDQLSADFQNENLIVHPSTYLRDRRAREDEIMQRWSVQAGPVTHAMRQHQDKILNVPIAQLKNSRTARENNTPTFQAPPTSSVTAPVHNVLPPASQKPDPRTTSIPLSPVTSGSSINNVAPTPMSASTAKLITNSVGVVHEIPPTNTASSSGV